MDRRPLSPAGRFVRRIANFARFGLARVISRHWGATHQIRRARLGIFALTLVSLYWLASGSALVGATGFEHYCRVFDDSPWLTGLETVVVFGPVAALLIADYRTMRSEKWQWTWQMWANRLLALVSLGYVALYVAVLRAPWLLGQAGESDRVALWTARLSSAYAGVPLLAVTLALGFGAMLCSVSAACLRALKAAGNLDSPWVERNSGVVVWSLCTLVFLVGLATITLFATGGSI